jgi:hypothetical protein
MSRMVPLKPPPHLPPRSDPFRCGWRHVLRGADAARKAAEARLADIRAQAHSLETRSGRHLNQPPREKPGHP